MKLASICKWALMALFALNVHAAQAQQTSNVCAVRNGSCAADAVCTNAPSAPGGRTCTCKPGFTGNGFTCAVNVCMTSNGGCSPNAICNNVPGAPGGRTCACQTGYSGDGKTCVDINECMSNNGGCNANAICTNTVGRRTCACKPGFTGDGIATCADVNECAINNGGCSPNGTCTNTLGSRTCACKPGFAGDGVVCNAAAPSAIPPLAPKPVAQPTPAPAAPTPPPPVCSVQNGGCSKDAVCTNMPSLREGRICKCKQGFTGSGVTCVDVDECKTNIATCTANSTCTNTVGSFACTCNPGYTSNGGNCLRTKK